MVVDSTDLGADQGPHCCCSVEGSDTVSGAGCRSLLTEPGEMGVIGAEAESTAILAFTRSQTTFRLLAVYNLQTERDVHVEHMK